MAETVRRGPADRSRATVTEVRILLARHGQTDWNRQLRIQGHADPPLNALGREQAHALAEELAGTALDAVYSSDLRRAAETAEIVAAPKGLPVALDSGLREVDVGSWSGLTLAEVRERFPGAERHDGETPDELASRLVATVKRIAADHDGAQLLLVSHGGALRALWRRAGGEPLAALANCGVLAVAFRKGELRAVH